MSPSGAAISAAPKMVQLKWNCQNGTGIILEPNLPGAKQSLSGKT
jgi:hypothetical protein